MGILLSCKDTDLLDGIADVMKLAQGKHHTSDPKNSHVYYQCMNALSIAYNVIFKSVASDREEQQEADASICENLAYLTETIGEDK